MKFEIGMSTGIGYRDPIEKVLGPIREEGWTAIEVATSSAHIDLRDVRRLTAVARQIVGLGLRCHSLHAPFGDGIDIAAPDPELRASSINAMRRAADALAVLGGRLFVIHPGGENHDWIWERDARLSRSAESLATIWEICRERKLELVVETPLPHLLGGQPHDLAWLLERLPRDAVRVCIDTSHTSLGRFLFDAIALFKDRLVHVQASDNHGNTDDHLPPGEGRIVWSDVVTALERIDYRGLFLLELTAGQDVASHIRWASARARETLGRCGSSRPAL